MRTVETPVHTFDELSESAKEAARDWYRHGLEFDEAEWVLDDAKARAKILGIDISEIYYSGFGSQGDGACFTGSYAYSPGAAAAIREDAPNGCELHAIADTLQSLQRPHFYALTASIAHVHRYCHEHSVEITVCDQNGELSADNPAAADLADALRDFMRLIYRSLESAWEYQNSYECVDDCIRANEYEFTADGTFFLE